MYGTQHSAGIVVVALSSCRLDGADSFAQWGTEYLRYLMQSLEYEYVLML